MADKPITVFLADDFKMVREALAAMLSHEPELEVVGQCGDGRTALKQIKKLRPDVVVTDDGMPKMNGFDLCRKVTKKIKGITVLFLAMSDDERFIARAFEYGASGYLLKEKAIEHLLEAIRTVVCGELYLDPSIPTIVLDWIRSGRDDPYKLLTPREKQVLQLLAEGETINKIAEELGLTIETVETHRRSLTWKLDIGDPNDSYVNYRDAFGPWGIEPLFLSKKRKDGNPRLPIRAVPSQGNDPQAEDKAMESKAQYDRGVDLLQRLAELPKDDPDKALATISLYHFESAIRAATRQTEPYQESKGVIDGCGFESWAEIMVDDLGDRVRPHLKGIWQETADARDLIRDEVLSEMEGRRSMMDAFASVFEAAGDDRKYPPVGVLSLDATWEQVTSLIKAFLSEDQRAVLLGVIASHRRTPLLLRVTIRTLNALLEQG